MNQLLLLTLLACGGDDKTDPGGPTTPSDGTIPTTPTTPTTPTSPVGCEDACSWCDPDAWGGEVPTESTDVAIPSGATVIVDCDAEAHTLTVADGGTLFASRETSSTLTLHGNLVTRGVVDYGTPDDRVPDEVTAEIVFTDLDDEQVVGTPTVYDGPEVSTSVDTPMTVVDSDVGLWVMGSGTLRAAGTLKSAWSTLVDGAGPGDPDFTVLDATGWRPDDAVVLTPTGTFSDGGDRLTAFSEVTVAEVDGADVTLASAPNHTHAGCVDCVRRGEAANLTRNVVIRSADASAHAHILVAEEGVAQLDSVELRWLGPTHACGGEGSGFSAPDRRAPLYFHQQRDASEASFVRHTSIWGAGQHFVAIEQSNGVEVTDVAGYDTHGVGFNLFYDYTGCGTRCTDRDKASGRTVFDHVLAAKVGVPERVDGCLRIDHRMAGFVVSGGEGSGARGSVAVGVGYDGDGSDIAGFGWAEGGSAEAVDFTFVDNVAHDNEMHGALIWQNFEHQQPVYDNNQFWSNGGYGVHWGAYENGITFDGTVLVDNGLASLGVKAIPQGPEERMTGATLDDLTVLAYVFIQEEPAIFRDLRFTGDRPLAISQLHDPCDGGDENDPNDTTCLRVRLRFEDPVFPAGVVPFDFGQTFNRYSIWEIRGFSSPDYPDLPADFDLYRPDNQVAGGSYYPDFDAWLVPNP